MKKRIGHVTGIDYKGKSPVDNLVIDRDNRDVYVGQRDQSQISSASLLLGKVVERVPANDLFDFNTWLDAAFPHVVFIAGKRGSGKSYDMGIILEGLHGTGETNFSKIPAGFCSVLFDLQNQFWTLGQQLNNEIATDKDQAELVKKWNLHGQVATPTVLLPYGSESVIGDETEFVIPPSLMELSDWLSLLKVDRFEPMGQLMSVVLQKTVLVSCDYEIDDLVQSVRSGDADPDISNFQQGTVDALTWRLSAIRDVKLFRNGQDPISAILTSGSVSVILLRELDDDIKAIVVAVTMRHIERKMSKHQHRRRVAIRSGKHPESDLPNRVWCMIDEAHLVCPSDNKTSANKVIVDYVKRGRDAGLSLVLATQQPSAIDTSAISQVDFSLIHKLTIDADIAAAIHRLPSPLPKDIQARTTTVSDARLLIRELPPGYAILADAEASRAFIIKLRPRVCPHGGGEPLL